MTPIQSESRSPKAASRGKADLGGRDLVTAITHSLDSLPEQDREVFVLRHYSGLSDRDISKRCGMPVDDVRSRLLNASSHLFNCLRTHRQTPKA